jgi:hypothetical protein
MPLSVIICDHRWLQHRMQFAQRTHSSTLRETKIVSVSVSVSLSNCVPFVHLQLNYNYKTRNMKINNSTN